MKTALIGIRVMTFIVFVLGWGFCSRDAFAHCDTLDGPVVAAAKASLDKGDVTPVLKWVRREGESEVVKAFANTLAVRKMGPEAKELADMYFFETVVRIHRAGEGAPYTGLKPAGSVEPIISAADKALESGSVESLVKSVSEAVARGIRERFAHAAEKKKHADESVEVGREFVEAYIEFVHYVERIHYDATTSASGHEASEGAAPEGSHIHP